MIQTSKNETVIPYFCDKPPQLWHPPKRRGIFSAMSSGIVNNVLLGNVSQDVNRSSPRFSFYRKSSYCSSEPTSECHDDGKNHVDTDMNLLNENETNGDQSRSPIYPAQTAISNGDSMSGVDLQHHHLSNSIHPDRSSNFLRVEDAFLRPPSINDEIILDKGAYGQSIKRKSQQG